MFNHNHYHSFLSSLVSYFKLFVHVNLFFWLYDVYPYVEVIPVCYATTPPICWSGVLSLTFCLWGLPSIVMSMTSTPYSRIFMFDCLFWRKSTWFLPIVACNIIKVRPTILSEVIFICIVLLATWQVTINSRSLLLDNWAWKTTWNEIIKLGRRSTFVWITFIVIERRITSVKPIATWGHAS